MRRVRRARVLHSLWWLLLLLPLQASALTLHDLVVRSLPGQPLRAHIPLSLEGDESLSAVHITLASAEEYAQRQLSRPELLEGMRLALLQLGEGRGRLQLFGERPWQGEAAELLFIIHAADTATVRQFSLTAVTPSKESTPLYVEVAQDETLDEIAIRLSKGRNRSYLHMMYALFLANPEAFYHGNINNLKSGSLLRVPSDEELYSLSDKEVYRGIREQDEQWQQLRDSAAAKKAALSAEQLSAESEALRRENEALQQRLKALEQRMQSVTGLVLEYAGSAPAEAGQQMETPAASNPPAAAAAAQSEAAAEPEGLSASGMFGAIVLVVLFALYIWYSAGHKHRWRS